jgi:hypothetical protein
MSIANVNAAAATGFSNGSIPVIVVGKQYLTDKPRGFTIIDGMEGNAVVKDNFNYEWFKMETRALTMHRRRLIYDENRNPILTMRGRWLTFPMSFDVYRGESISGADRLYKYDPKLITLHKRAYIYLNDGDHKADFMVRADWRKFDFKIFDIRQGLKRYIGECSRLRAPDYSVQVAANVDAAFITSICLLQDQRYTPKLNAKERDPQKTRGNNFT